MVRRALVGGVLSMVSASCWSLSLGPFTGQAVLGQPLALTIPLGVGADESTTELCPLVRVYFAEDIVSSGQVKVTVRTDAANNGTVLHVSTSAPLNEPYARVDVVVGCTNQFSRQYTILADLPSLETPQTGKAATTVALPVSRAVALSVVAAPAQTTVSQAAGSQVNAAPRAANKPAKTTPDPWRSADKPRTVAAARAPGLDTAAPQGARLQLDPVELVASMVQLSPALKMASDGFVAADTTADPELAQRRAAARALWQALNETPEQAATSALKAETAVAENQALKAQLTAAKQAEADMQAALTTEREGIYTHPLVLALGGVLLLLLGGGALVLSRSKNVAKHKQPWWNRQAEKVVQTDKPAQPVKQPTPPKAKSKLTGFRASLVRWWRNRKRQSEHDTFFPSDSMFKGGPVSRHFTLNKGDDQGLTTLGGGEFSASTLMNGARSMATEELFDLQQQVEFFISLGQAEQAVDVLVAHVSDSQEPSPLAYLDLLRLYHDLERRTEYEALRKDFNRLFSGSAPAFDDYSYSRRGLERYEAALSRIQSLWPTPAVLDVIERSIFRQSAADEQDVFDLEAYRELLLLYGIARELIEPDSMMGNVGAASSFGFLGDETPVTVPHATVIQPLTAQTRESRARDDAAAAHSDTPAAPDTVLEHRAPDTTLDAVDLDLDLNFDLNQDTPLHVDIDLSDGGLQLAHVTPHAVAPDADAGDPMSFDLSDSLFDALMEPGEASKATAAPQRETGLPKPGGDASLDFSDLDGMDNFTIRKSGTPS